MNSRAQEDYVGQTPQETAVASEGPPPRATLPTGGIWGMNKPGMLWARGGSTRLFVFKTSWGIQGGI